MRNQRIFPRAVATFAVAMLFSAAAVSADPKSDVQEVLKQAQSFYNQLFPGESTVVSDAAQGSEKVLDEAKAKAAAAFASSDNSQNGQGSAEEPALERRLLSLQFAPYFPTNDEGASVNFALGALGSTVGEVQGVQIAGLIAESKGDMVGAQIGGIMSTAKTVTFLQLAGIFNAAADVNGMQGAGIFSTAEELKGLQASGIFNAAQDVYGMQVGGIFNGAADVHGAQIAGIFNAAADVEGIQAAGIVNVAKKVTGVQIGLINIADEVDGIAIGLLNISRGNINETDVWYSQTGELYSGLLVGGKNLYAIGYVGGPSTMFTAAPDALAWGAGLGFRFNAGEAIYVETDASLKALTSLDNLASLNADVIGATTQFFGNLRIAVGLKFFGPVGIFAGVDADFGGLSGSGWEVPGAFQSGGWQKINFGAFEANIHYFFGASL